MADPHEHAAFTGDWWEEHYRSTESTEQGGHQPGPQLVAEVTGLGPGTALDAGCGTGADAVWLAGLGWEVTAVDISATAVDRARTEAGRLAPDVAGLVTWLVADVTTWEPASPFDLVVSQYVHPDTTFEAFVSRLAGCVAPGGTLLVAGHDHGDRHAATHAPQDASIDPVAVAAVLDPHEWQVETAETRPRQVRRAGAEVTMRDVVVKARRR
jgi:SAM-dependent methyltransferase